jgi:hypothetical protein
VQTCNGNVPVKLLGNGTRKDVSKCASKGAIEGVSKGIRHTT